MLNYLLHIILKVHKKFQVDRLSLTIKKTYPSLTNLSQITEQLTNLRVQLGPSAMMDIWGWSIISGTLWKNANVNWLHPLPPFWWRPHPHSHSCPQNDYLFCNHPKSIFYFALTPPITKKKKKVVELLTTKAWWSIIYFYLWIVTSEKALSQWPHCYGFSPVCDLICIIRWLFSEKAMPHWLHW